MIWCQELVDKCKPKHYRILPPKRRAGLILAEKPDFCHVWVGVKVFVRNSDAGEEARGYRLRTGHYLKKDFVPLRSNGLAILFIVRPCGEAAKEQPEPVYFLFAGEDDVEKLQNLSSARKGDAFNPKIIVSEHNDFKDFMYLHSSAESMKSLAGKLQDFIKLGAKRPEGYWGQPESNAQLSALSFQRPLIGSASATFNELLGIGNVLRYDFREGEEGPATGVWSPSPPADDPTAVPQDTWVGARVHVRNCRVEPKGSVVMKSGMLFQKIIEAMDSGKAQIFVALKQGAPIAVYAFRGDDILQELKRLRIPHSKKFEPTVETTSERAPPRDARELTMFLRNKCKYKLDSEDDKRRLLDKIVAFVRAPEAMTRDISYWMSI